MEQNATVKYILWPFLTEAGTTLIAAPNKSMKTFAGLNMAVAIAAGGTFVDQKTVAGRVLYIDREIGIAEAKKRYAPLQLHYDNPENFFIHTRDEEPLSLEKDTRGYKNLKLLFDKVKPDVVFFDALRFMHRREESSNTEMAGVMESIRDLKIEFRMTPVIIHHMGKLNDDGPKSSRGASVIEDSPDSIGYINTTVGHGEVPSRMSVSWKLRNHAPVDPSRWTFNSELGIFVPTPRKEKVNGKRTQDPSGAERQVQGFDISAGLLQPVSEDN